jgi:hypothetical protein
VMVPSRPWEEESCERSSASPGEGWGGCMRLLPGQRIPASASMTNPRQAAGNETHRDSMEQ